MNNPLDEINFHQLKIYLFDKKGLSYFDFKKKLTPDFFKVWRDIMLGWLCLAALLTAFYFIALQINGLTFTILLCLLTAATAGYIIAYLINFFHEAAHYNIAENKKMNDMLANLIIGILIGQGIKYYRIIHWEHHKSLGTGGDTERSYFEKLNFNFILFSLTGIRILGLLKHRNDFITAGKKKYTTEVKKEARLQLLLSILLHSIFIGLLAWKEQWWLIGVWVLAVGCFYPLFNSLRQLLEHRNDLPIHYAENTNPGVGKLTRLFGNSIFEKTFGSAGFNKHLLHHLEPQISYTKTDELELFLRETIIAGAVKNKKTTYLKTFIKIFGK